MYNKDVNKLPIPKQTRTSKGKGKLAREALLSLRDGESLTCTKYDAGALRLEMRRLHAEYGRSGRPTRYVSLTQGHVVRVWRRDGEA